MRKTYAEINLRNLVYNYTALKRKAGNRKVMAVVKADAYGHGMIKVVEALEKLGNDKPAYYGVALTEEAIELRKSRITKAPILTFSPFSINEIDDYYKYKIYPTIVTTKQIDELRKANLAKPLRIHINVDTGMGRLGIKHDEAVNAITKLSKLQNVVIDGIYTHFATSDERDKTYTKLQISRFNKVLDELHSRNIKTGIVHSANSGAIIDHEEAYYDMIRPGISLYGYYPSQETSESVKLKPVMSLITHVSNIKKLREGESVSYGRIFTAPKDMSVFTVPVGYADGYNRNLSNKARAIKGDNLFTQIGRVTMDRIIFDPGNTKVKVNDKIILLGSNKYHKFDAWDWSEILNTIPYEITCNISKRVPRIYKG